MAKIGFIGAGNMGKAMLKGLCKTVDTAELLFTDYDKEHCKEVFHETGVMFADSNAELASKSKYVVLAVKPNVYDTVLKNIVNVITPDHVIISLAPGKSIDELLGKLGILTRIVRCMPNTPALVGEGMTGISYDEKLFSEEEIKDAMKPLHTGKAPHPDSNGLGLFIVSQSLGLLKLPFEFAPIPDGSGMRFSIHLSSAKSLQNVIV
jgi:pyrroline-5-carboxylate reductase